jgi:hypothetical protein
MQRDSSGTVSFDIQTGRVAGQQMDTDKRVVGFRGQASSLHYRTRFTEELLAQTPAADASKAPPAPQGKTEAKPAKASAAPATTPVSQRKSAS